MTRNKIEALLLEAKECLQQGRRDDALGCIRTALAVDPGEMVITEVILNMERIRTSPPENIGKNVPTKVERNSAENMDPKLEKAFRLSDEALEAGDDAKALAYMKKASRLFPDEAGVQEKLNLLKNRIRAGNLVKIGLKSLEEGNLKKAVSASRKAFDLMPGANGLDELLSAMEKVKEPVHEDIPPQEKSSVPQSGAMLWADRIRAAVKDEKFEEAGKMVAEAVKNHPNHPLLDSFHIKLKRLGFAD